MTKVMNPWENMYLSTMRRVDANKNFNFFWVLDATDKYGFCVQSEELLNDSNKTINLRGITIVKRNENNSIGSMYLVLNSKDDWQIFHVLCEDLINTAKKCKDKISIITAIEKRLMRWQQLLKTYKFKDLSKERQMGLFAELICLRDIVSLKYGIKQAVNSWVGPEYDKQDFLLDNGVIEVKSYRTSKGELVHISSLQQLQSPKKPFYLIAIGITCNETGLSVNEIAESIKKLLCDDEENIEIFEMKLSEYGFIPELVQKQELYKFIIDIKRAYDITESFPKILRNDIKSQIVEVKYVIDLEQCRQFEIPVNELFGER